MATSVQLRYKTAELRTPVRWDWTIPRAYVGVGVTRPLDDMLALLAPDAAVSRVDYLHGIYCNAGRRVGDVVVPTGGVPGVGLFPDDLAAVKRLIRKWQREKLPERFHDAAIAASEGRLSASIAPHVETIIFVPEQRGAIVEDFPALAAWSVWIVVQEGGLSVRPCEHCGLPWMATERGRYCERAAPDSPSGSSCRDVAKVRDFRARKKGGQ